MKTTDPTEQETRAEAAVAAALRDAWGCELREFARYSPIDYYAERDGQVAGFVEIKTSARYAAAECPSVFLSFRKWTALAHASLAFGCPGVFVVKLTDGIYWASVDQIGLLPLTIGGHRRPRRGAAHDREPGMRVPIATMRRLL